MIEFLEGVLSSLRRRNFLDERDDGRRSLERFRERGNEKGRGGAILRGHDGDAIGDARIAIGHDAAGVFGAICGLFDAIVRRSQMKSRRDTLPEDD